MVTALPSFNFADKALCTRCMGNARGNVIVKFICVTLRGKLIACGV